MEHNYVILPSNGSMTVHPNNTLANFKIKLPRPLHFDKPSEVALVEIIYPSAHLIIPNNTEYLKFFKTNKAVNNDSKLIAIEVSPTDNNNDGTMHYEEAVVETIFLKGGTYRTSTQLFSALKNAFIKHTMQLKFDTKENRFSIYGFENRDIEHIELSPILGSMLGYGEQLNSNILIDHDGDAPYNPDLMGGQQSMFIYCNIVENQYLGDQFAPLLRVVCPDSSKNETEMISEKYIKPYYLKVCKSYIDEIEISIQTATGKPYPFQSGSPVILKLHFNQIV